MSTVYTLRPDRPETFTKDQIEKIAEIHEGLGIQLALAAFLGTRCQPASDTPRKIPDDSLFIVNPDAPPLRGENALVLRNALSASVIAVPFTYRFVKSMAVEMGVSSGSPAYLVREGHLLEQTNGE